MMWRALSGTASPGNNLRELKRHVLRLYKHIHPDRLGRYPHHRAVNESSFQVLQSAIERHFDRVEARTKNIPPQAPQSPQHLTFFATHTDGLKKAVVKFHESRLGHALHSLFEELGLDPPPAEVLPGGRVQGVAFSSLTELVKHARHIAMMAIKRQETVAKEAQAMDDEVVVTRLALQRSRGVRVTLGDGLPGEGRLVHIFRRLVSILREIRGEDLSSLVVEFDGGFGTNLNTDGVFPWLSLGACASDESWKEVLQSAAVRAACDSSRSYMSGVQLLEAMAAKDLGVRLVMHDISLGDATEGDAVMRSVLDALVRGTKVLQVHRETLESLREKGVGGATVKVPGVSSLVLMLSQTAGTQCDTEEGVLRIGLDQDADTILGILRNEGPRINQQYEQGRLAREAEQKKLTNVKRALGIDSLRRHDHIGDREWHEALSHMREDAGRLRGVLDGIPIVIGTEARILGDSGEIEIPFDFRRAMVI